MFRSITIAAAAVAVLAGGALTATATNSHAGAVSKLATSTTVSGEARGDAVSALASARGEKTSDNAKPDAATDKSARDAEADADAAATLSGGDKTNHGDAVSDVAKDKGETSSCPHGDKTVTNHGCAVSAVAQKH